jgi:TOBE domain-containing protein
MSRPVEIAGVEPEGMIRRLRRSAQEVVVELVLADGTPATARMTPEDADWLELRAGDIVGVRPVSA